MNLKVLARLTLVAAVITIFVSGFNTEAFSQHNRPRYSSRNYNDRGGTIPPDTIINMRMNQTLSSRTSRVGDRFTATVADPVSINGREVIPTGTIVEGRVTQVTPAKRMSRAGTIAVDFESIVMPDGRRLALAGSLTSDDPEVREKIDDENSVRGSSNDRNTVFVGGGGAIGAILGGIAGGGKGAIIGGGVGAGIGLAGVLLSKGEEAEVRAGTPFGIKLQQSLTINSDPSFDNSSRNNDPNNRDNDPNYTDPRDNYPRDNDPRANDNKPRWNRKRDRDRDRDQDYDRSNRRDTDPQRDAEPQRDTDPNRDTESREPEQKAEPVPNPADSRGEPEREPEPITRPETNTTEPPPATESLPLSSAEMIRRAQVALQEQGYYEGKADGLMNPRTSNALKTFQRENNLQQTGDLDPATADKLGIMRATPVAGRRETRPSGSAPTGSVKTGNTNTGNSSPGDQVPSDRVVLANVLSATANRTADGALYIMINTQANTGGWRWFGEKVANGDTLEVYARAVRPTGIVTQALTRGKIELNVTDGVDYVRRVVVHGAGGDITIPLGSNSRPTEASNTRTNDPVNTRSNESQPSSSSNIQRQAEQMLSEFQRLIGLRTSGNRMEIDPRYGDTEIELLFSLDNFANAARLYSRLIGGIRDRREARAATLSLAKEARKTDRLITTTSSTLADSVNRSWDSVRLEVVKLIRAYNIDSSELDN